MTREKVSRSFLMESQSASELRAAADREGCTSGEFIRRAIADRVAGTTAPAAASGTSTESLARAEAAIKAAAGTLARVALDAIEKIDARAAATVQQMEEAAAREKEERRDDRVKLQTGIRQQAQQVAETAKVLGLPVPTIAQPTPAPAPPPRSASPSEKIIESLGARP